MRCVPTSIPRIQTALGAVLGLLVSSTGLVSCGFGGHSSEVGSEYTRVGPNSSPGPETHSERECSVTIGPDQSLKKAIERAESGAHICLEPGEWTGRYRIDKSLTISGTPETRVINRGEDSTFHIEANDVALRNFVISGSGDRYQEQDAGVFMVDSNRVRLENLEMRDVLFGISAQKSNKLRIRSNEIHCRTQRALGMRGDGIRLWEIRRSLVKGNVTRECRDMVVWYSPENAILNNAFTDGRYGIHFMYSSRNYVRGNRLTDNVVGIFVMYSRNIGIDFNLIAGSGGSGGIGIGLKESGNLEITRNMFLDNTEGTYVDNSPLQRPDHILYGLNQFRLNNRAVEFLNSPNDIRFQKNAFKDNQQPVGVQGNGRAIGIPWNRNFFSGYEGYDWDADGIGDVPHVYRSWTGNLMGEHPKLRFFSGMPSLSLIETASQVSPMMTPESLLKDEQPLVSVPSNMTSETIFTELRNEHGILDLDESGLFPVVEGMSRSGGY